MRPFEEVLVFFDSVAEAVDVYRAIENSRKPLRIASHTPNVSYWHEEKPRNYERESSTDSLPSDEVSHGRNGDESRKEPEWTKTMTIYGLPPDFKASFEIEGLIHHILGLPHHIRPISRIDISESPDPAHSQATVVFTEQIHLLELLNRTYGQVVFRGFPLALVCSMPPVTSEEQPTDPNATTDTAGQPNNVYPPFAHHPPHMQPPLGPNSDTYHHMSHPFPQLWNTPHGNINNDETNSHRHLESSMDVDESQSHEANSQHAHTSEEVPHTDTAPLRTGPVEFSFKAQIPSSTPKTSLQLSSSSKLLPTSALSQTSASSRLVPTKPNVRSGRHFVNIPSDRPARATLPMHTEKDLPFIRGNICLLCRSQLPSIEATQRHVKESQQHFARLAQLLERHDIASARYDWISLETEYIPHNPKKRSREEETEDFTLDDNLPSMGASTPVAEDSNYTHSESSSNLGMKMLQRMGYTGGAFGRSRPTT